MRYRRVRNPTTRPTQFSKGESYTPGIDDASGFKVAYPDLVKDYDGTLRTPDKVDGWHPANDPPSIIYKPKPIKNPRPDGAKQHIRITPFPRDVHPGFHIGLVLELPRIIANDSDTLLRTYHFWTSELANNTNPAATTDIVLHVGGSQVDWDIPSYTDNRYLYIASDSMGAAPSTIRYDNDFLNQIGAFQSAGTGTINSRTVNIMRTRIQLLPMSDYVMNLGV